MDPHKRSATIEVMDPDEAVLGGGRFGTDRDGYDTMLRYGRQWPDRVWAVEGCAGIGKHIAKRLLMSPPGSPVASKCSRCTPAKSAGCEWRSTVPAERVAD